MTKTNKKVTRIDKPIKNITRIIKLPNKGDSGYTPVKGKDYFDGETPSDEKLLSLITPRIPKPIKGENGKDGKSFTKKEVRDLIDESLAEKMPELMADLEGRGTVSVEELNKGFNLVIKGKKYYIGGDVVGPKLRLLVQMGDLDLPNGLVGQSGKVIKVKTNESGFELGTGGGGAVDSVNGETGVVVLDQDDIGDGTTYKQYSQTEKTKLAGIETGAEVNVNADWNAVAGDAVILNKPSIPTQYTDELAQDAVGNAVGTGLDYDDTTGAISVDETELAVPAANVIMPTDGGSPTLNTLAEEFTTKGSSGVADGTITYVTVGTSATKISVASGEGYIRTTNDQQGELKFCKWAASPDLYTFSAPAAGFENVIFIGVEYSGGTVSAVAKTAFTDWNWYTNFPLARCSYDGTTVRILNAYAHAEDTANLTRKYLRLTMPFTREEAPEGSGGLELSVALRALAMTAGKVWHGFNNYSLGAVASGSAFDTHYKKAGGGFVTTTGVTAYPNTQYDNGSGTLQNLTASKYGTLWVYVDVADGSLDVVYGAVNATSVANAQLDTIPTTPEHLRYHGRLIGRIIFKKSDPSPTLVESAWTSVFGASAVGDHALLTNLQGGTANEYYHLTAAQATVVGNTSNTNTGDQTIANSSDATSHTITLSASGGSVQFIEGTNITLTTGGTASAGTVTIAASGGSGDVTKVGTPVNNQVGVWTGDGTLEGDVDLTFDTSTNTLQVGAIGLDGIVQTHSVKSDASDGLLIEAANGTDVGLLGVGNTANATWNGSHNFEGGQVAVGKSATTLGKLKLYGNTSGDVTIQPNAVAGTGIVLTTPATTGTLALTSDIPAAGANTALSNLASVAINTSLVSDTDNTDDLGTTLKKWANLFVTTIGATATRVTKGWFTDLEVTNAITGSITGNAATVTTNANLTGDVTSTGNATTIANSAVTLAKMANLAQDQFIGRTTASTGVPETATITAAARTVLDDTTVAAMVDTLGGATSTGTGGIARATSPTFVTPALGTPSSGNLSNCTGIPAPSGIGWALKEYSTATASGITSGTLDLSTDLKYKIFVQCSAPSATSKTLYGQINGVTTASSYWNIMQGRNYDGTTAANENLDFKDSQWQFTSNGWNTYAMEFDLSLLTYDGTNTRVVGHSNVSGFYQDSTEKIMMIEGTHYQTTQTNVTSINFNVTSGSWVWKMWIYTLKTS